MPRLGKQSRNRQKWLRSHEAFYQRESAVSTPDEVVDRSDHTLTLRAFSLRPDSINEADRSVDAVIATETPAIVFDYFRWEPIDEVLRMDGAELPADMPVLANHNRATLDAVLGSARNMRTQDAELPGRLFFVKDDEEADKAWNKVSQGHLRNVSVGYQVSEYTDIEPGQSGIVQGKTYTAGKRTLRITTKWVPREVSLVPIGADPKATLRQKSDQRGVSRTTSPGDSGIPLFAKVAQMPKALRDYLASLGLRADASDAEAWDHFRTLQGEQFALATQLLQGETPALAANGRAASVATVPTPPLAAASDTVARGESAPALAANAPAANAVAGQLLVAPDGAREERARVAAILELAREDVPQTLARQAIAEGWSQERASVAFLEHIRGARGGQQQPGEGGGPAIHVRGRELDCTRMSLTSGFLQGRTSLDPVKHWTEVLDGTPTRRRNGAPTQDLEQAADRGYRYRGMAIRDVMAEACRIDGLSFDRYSDVDLLRSATSSSTLTAIFTTAFSAQFLSGYLDAPDSTIGWCSEADVANFQSNERATMGAMGSLSKHRRGGVAEDMDTSDSKETYKLARYSGKFTCDEMDLIDDRFGALETTSPQEMGDSARAIRPNLVYYILLANAALGADSIALFEAATHKNLGEAASAFAAATLQAGITAMSKQRIGKRPKNIRPRFLIVPQDLKFAAKIVLKSAERIISASSDGTYNPLADEGIEWRSDDRIGVAGVVDPATGTAQAGTATNWFLMAKPGEAGAKTIEVGYRRGTGRAPQIRTFTLDKGSWGIGWDINLDIGGKALDFRGAYKATGAGA